MSDEMMSGIPPGFPGVTLTSSVRRQNYTSSVMMEKLRYPLSPGTHSELYFENWKTNVYSLFICVVAELEFKALKSYSRNRFTRSVSMTNSYPGNRSHSDESDDEYSGMGGVPGVVALPNSIKITHRWVLCLCVILMNMLITSSEVNHSVEIKITIWLAQYEQLNTIRKKSVK